MIAAVLLRALSDGLCPAVEHPSIALATLVIATQSRAASVRAITESAFEDSISSAEDYAPFINGERGKPRREGGRKLMEWMANALKRIEIPTRNGQMIALADKPIADITTADVEAVRIHWPLKT